MEATTMKRSSTWLAVALALTAASCVDSTGDQGGLDMRSRGTSERNQRLGNDPAEQNTGRGSTREEEPQQVPQQDAPQNPRP
jgi:hypothetical protein